MGLFQEISDFFTGPADSLGVNADSGTPTTDFGNNDSGGMAQDTGHGYCTASGSEPTWHNDYGTAADLSHVETSSFDCSSTTWEM